MSAPVERDSARQNTRAAQQSLHRINELVDKIDSLATVKGHETKNYRLSLMAAYHKLIGTEYDKLADLMHRGAILAGEQQADLPEPAEARRLASYHRAMADVYLEDAP